MNSEQQRPSLGVRPQVAPIQPGIRPVGPGGNYKSPSSLLNTFT